MVLSDLQLLDLDFERSGYRRFISCWVARSAVLTCVVDPGPAASMPQLLAGLRDAGVQDLDYILLTHIHIDHGGCAGHLLDVFPEAKIVCHPRAVTHLLQPDRLWEGSRAVLRDKAALFGRPRAVPESAIASASAVEEAGITVIRTPGHAPHHLSFLWDDVLFAGEAAGTRFPLPDGGIYMRPATPPRFRPDIALDSLQRLLAQTGTARRLAFAHYGAVEEPRRYLEIAAAQIPLWIDVVASLAGDGDWSQDLQDRAISALISADPCFAPFSGLPDDIRARESEFFRNTLEGILGWLQHGG